MLSLGVTAHVIAWLLGAATLAAVEPRWGRGPTLPSRLAACAFAAAIGTALAAGLYWIWIVLLRGTGAPYVAVELGVLLALLAVACLRRAPSGTVPRHATDRAAAAAWLAGAVLVLTAVALTSSHVSRTPYGAWDAWAMWNMKAKFLYHAHADWSLIFGEVGGHGDYPLLLPLTVARTWCYMGTDAQWGAQLTTVVFTGLTASLMLTGMAMLRGPLAAAVGLALWLSMPLTRTTLGLQYADAPLAGWMIGACLCAALSWERSAERRGWLLATGALAAAAAWTKNEGAIFCVAMLLSLSVMLLRDEKRRAWRHIAILWAAALPLLACLAWMKLRYAGGSYFVEAHSVEQALAYAADPERHAHILRLWRSIVTHTTGGRWVWIFAAVWLALRGMQVRGAVVLWLALIAVQLGAYYVAYAITPADLRWQLATSASRVLFHVTPIVAMLPPLLSRANDRAAGGCPSDQGPRDQL